MKNTRRCNDHVSCNEDCSCCNEDWSSPAVAVQAFVVNDAHQAVLHAPGIAQEHRVLQRRACAKTSIGVANVKAGASTRHRHQQPKIHANVLKLNNPRLLWFQWSQHPAKDQRRGRNTLQHQGKIGRKQNAAGRKQRGAN